MPERLSRPYFLARLCLVSATLCLPATVSAQSAGLPSGGITGTVTANGPNGTTIKGANVLVQLWTTDAVTEAKRDSACATWLADKTIWMQAKGEVESPSGVNWTGTAVGNDVALLNSLLALRRDTTRADANGEFKFASVPFGAYTVEAETFANDKFLQWSKDVAVIPNTIQRIALDPSTLAENQYCTVSTTGSGNAGGASGGKVYDSSELDKPLELLSGGVKAAPSATTQNTVTIAFVVNENGIPDLQTVQVKQSTGDRVAADAARDIVSKLKYSVPMVKGVAVRANVLYVAPAPASGGGRRRR